MYVCMLRIGHSKLCNLSHLFLEKTDSVSLSSHYSSSSQSGSPEKSHTHTGIVTVVVIVKIVLGDSIVEISGVRLSVTHTRHFLIADVLVC